jgi:hypothetical protein
MSLEKVCHRQFFDEMSVAKKDNPLASVLDFTEDMRGQQNGAACLPRFHD